MGPVHLFWGAAKARTGFPPHRSGRWARTAGRCRRAAPLATWPRLTSVAPSAGPSRSRRKSTGRAPKLLFSTKVLVPNFGGDEFEEAILGLGGHGAQVQEPRADAHSPGLPASPCGREELLRQGGSVEAEGASSMELEPERTNPFPRRSEAQSLGVGGPAQRDVRKRARFLAFCGFVLLPVRVLCAALSRPATPSVSPSSAQLLAPGLPGRIRTRTGGPRRTPEWATMAHRSL